MAEVQRELAGRIVKALLLKGGYGVTAVSDLLEVSVTALDLERSAWPPFRPWRVMALGGAVVGQFTRCVVTLSSQAPTDWRLTIDSLRLTSSLAGWPKVHMGLLTAMGTLALYANAFVTDGGEDVAGGVNDRLDHVAAYTGSGAGAVVTVQGVQYRAPAANEPYEPLRSRRPIFILRAGQAVIFESEGANVQLTLEATGRLYT